MAKVGQISNEGSQCGSVYSDNGNSPTLTAGTHGDANSKVCTEYRIRKLTPKECWRLMDFSDADFHKAEKVNSNTQLYKQAGNSIVVNVLCNLCYNPFRPETAGLSFMVQKAEHRCSGHPHLSGEFRTRCSFSTFLHQFFLIFGKYSHLRRIPLFPP